MVTELSFYISTCAKSEEMVTNTNRNNTRLKYFVFMTTQYVINNRGRIFNNFSRVLYNLFQITKSE